eukprot:GDKK01069412.1.p1 GENE.GDKK01069412.1~~GDKK01069412.1.p1  ORF type:complete len:262 (+),score=7.46 GDKK01069412.1:1-786(+)
MGWGALWEPFSDVLEEERWRRRLQKRAELLSFEQRCERDKDGSEGLSVDEQIERLAIYKQWVREYTLTLPHQKIFRKSQLDIAIEAHAALVGAAAMDKWLKVVVLDHVNLQDALLREEGRGRDAIAHEGLVGGWLASGSTWSDRDVADTRNSEAQALFFSHKTQKALILAEQGDEPFHRHRIIRLELQGRLVATMPSSSPKAFTLLEGLGREAVEAAEAFDRYRGPMMSGLQQLQYDLWFAQLKAAGLPRRWRGEDVGSTL